MINTRKHSSRMRTARFCGSGGRGDLWSHVSSGGGGVGYTHPLEGTWDQIYPTHQKEHAIPYPPAKDMELEIPYPPSNPCVQTDTPSHKFVGVTQSQIRQLTLYQWQHFLPQKRHQFTNVVMNTELVWAPMTCLTRHINFSSLG